MNIEKELLEYLYVKLPAIIKLEMHERTRGCIPQLAPGNMLYKNWGESSRGSAEWLQRVARWEASNTMLWLGIEPQDSGYKERITRICVEMPRKGSWSRKGPGCMIPVFFSAISPDLLVYLKSLTNKGLLIRLPTNENNKVWPETPDHGVIAREYGRIEDLHLEELASQANWVANNKSVTSGSYFTAPQNTTKQETNTMQKLVNDMVTANKEALNVAAKLSVGKTANSTLLAALTSKLPWYAKLFGGKKDLMENPLARVASAQLAVALSKHFAPRNEKLAYVADAMLQESMVELITNGEQLQSLITQLEALAGNVTGETK